VQHLTITQEGKSRIAAMTDCLSEMLPAAELKRERRRRRKERIRSFIKEYLKSRNCEDCGTIENLTFHHRDPSKKKDDIGKLVSYKSFAKVEKEISKCDILCRHCHDIRHNMQKKKEDKEIDLCQATTRSSVLQDTPYIETATTLPSTQQLSFMGSCVLSVGQALLGITKCSMELTKIVATHFLSFWTKVK
jgi:5-methylcytosine-specific restriction endonuclease McrA